METNYTACDKDKFGFNILEIGRTVYDRYLILEIGKNEKTKLNSNVSIIKTKVKIKDIKNGAEGWVSGETLIGGS